MDLSQFDSLRKNIENLSYEQLEQIKIAEEDRKAREAALKKQEEIDLANAAMREDERSSMPPLLTLNLMRRKATIAA